MSIVIVIFLFIASAFFALAETAVSSVSRNKMKVSSERGDRRAKKVLYILDHFEDAITTLLICTNIAHIAAASVATVFVTRKWGLSAVTAATFIMTLLMFFLGEMLPKSIGKKTSSASSKACSGILVVLMKIFRPLSRLLSAIGLLASRRFENEEEASVTKDELYDIIEDMAEEGSIDEEQSELISSALQFGDVTASSILTPRVDIAGIDVKTEGEELLNFVQNQRHSRVLIYDGTIDNTVGVLQIRKFLKAYLKEKKIPDLKDLMDPVYYAHQSTEIDELLSVMSKNKLNMAVIMDGYGGTLGLVTVEDILEEIVGEIWDEDDVIKEPIVALTDDVCSVSGDETVLDTFDFLEYEENDPENEERFTNLLMADWICEQFTEIPKRGDSFTYGPLTVTVSEMAHNRIIRASVMKAAEREEDEA